MTPMLCGVVAMDPGQVLKTVGILGVLDPVKRRDYRLKPVIEQSDAKDTRGVNSRWRKITRGGAWENGDISRLTLGFRGNLNEPRWAVVAASRVLERGGGRGVTRGRLAGVGRRASLVP